MSITPITPQHNSKDVPRNTKITVNVKLDNVISVIKIYIDGNEVSFTTEPISNTEHIITYDPGKNAWRHRKIVTVYIHAEDISGLYTSRSYSFTTIDHEESLYNLSREPGWEWNKARVIPDNLRPAPGMKRVTDNDLSIFPVHIKKGGINDSKSLFPTELRSFGSITEPNWHVLLNHGNVYVRDNPCYIYSCGAIVIPFDPCKQQDNIPEISVPLEVKPGTPIFFGYFSHENGKIGISKELNKVIYFTSVHGPEIVTSKCQFDKGYCSVVDNKDNNVDTRKYYSNNCTNISCPLRYIEPDINTILWDEVPLNSDEFIYDHTKKKIIVNGSIECNKQTDVVGYTTGSIHQTFRTNTYPISEDAIVTFDGTPTDKVTIDYATGEIRLIDNDTHMVDANVKVEVEYNPVYVIIYEPTHSTNMLSSPNVHPIATGTEKGFICVSNWLQDMKNIRVVVDRKLQYSIDDTSKSSIGISFDVYGPVYLGLDFVAIDIYTEGSRIGQLVPNQPLYISALGSVFPSGDDVYGRINGKIIGNTEIEVKSDSSGVARLTYQPPRSPASVGYTIHKSFVTSNRITLPGKGIPYESLFTPNSNFVESDIILDTFVVRADDVLLGKYYSTTEEKEQAKLRGEVVWEDYGEIDSPTYGCNGRKELVMKLDNGNATIVRPLLSGLLNENNDIAEPGDNVKYIEYPVDLPTDVAAYYVSAPRHIIIYVRSKGNIASRWFGLEIDTPPHLRGEFILGGDDQKIAKGFDGISYFTINPYAYPAQENRYDTRVIGSVFSVLLTNNTYFRNRFSAKLTYPRFPIGETESYGIRNMFTISSHPESKLRNMLTVSQPRLSSLRNSVAVVLYHTENVPLVGEIVGELGTGIDIEFDAKLPKGVNPRYA